MRSQQEIKDEISEVEDVLATFGAARDVQSNVSLRFTYEKNRDRLAALEAELAKAQSGQLRWQIQNDAVAGHSIEARFLSDLLGKFDRSTRTVGSDIARLEDPHLGAPVDDVVSPMVVGTFAGSFGVVLEPKARGEQLQILAPPLFERTLGRILDLLTTQAAPPEDLADALLDRLEGIRHNSVVAVRDLSRVMGESGGTSTLAWEPNTATGRARRVSVTASQAAFVSQALAQVEAQDPIVREVQGLLVGSDFADKTFHLVEASTEEEYRGKVEDSVNEALNGAHGTGIRARVEVSEVIVISTRRRRVTYRLVGFDPAG